MPSDDYFNVVFPCSLRFEGDSQRHLYKYSEQPQPDTSRKDLF